MNVGLDVGYSATKAISGDRRVTFPSVTGTPDKARFSLDGASAIVLTAPDHVQVGAGAVTQSRFLQRREDRSWIESDEWYTLALAALSELTSAKVADLVIVTGLPVAYFTDADRKTVRDRLLGEHKLQRDGRHAQALRVTDCRVIPQPFGCLMSVCLDERGAICDQKIATGAVGVIDVGGKTTNLLSVNRLSEISHETASAGVGAWDAARAVRVWLEEHVPGLELRDHEVMQAIIGRTVRYYGEPVDLSKIVAATLEPLADQVIAEASQLWGTAASLDAILVSGGGALLLGPYIVQAFRHARVIDDPLYANSAGFWKFAQRVTATKVGVNESQ